jgi:hypothetical protein
MSFSCRGISFQPGALAPTREARKVQSRIYHLREASMSAYFVVELEITNPAAMEPYRAAEVGPDEVRK